MRSLFVMRRPGILVVSGTVTEVNGNVVTIRNTCHYPISNKEEETICHLTCKEEVIERMRLGKGASIIASTCDNFNAEMLLDGAEPTTREYELSAYTVRFNGSFDFECHGDQKEQHVMAGTVISAASGMQQGFTWNRILLGWKKKGQEEKRNITFWNRDGITCDDQKGKRMILVTGEEKKSNKGSYYQAQKIFDF